MKICIIGLGYVGLPLARLIYQAGFSVSGFDIDPKKQALEEKFPIYSELPQADVYFICVPTPVDEFPKEANLSYFWDAVNEIKKKKLNENVLVVIESTIPIGVTSAVKLYLGTKIVYSPERVYPGVNETRELTQNTRIVGVETDEEYEAILSIYDTFIEGEIIRTTYEEAEACKLIENTYRDVSLALANEISWFCKDKGLDPWRIRKIVNNHPRVDLLRPGTGVGGHCVPVDPWFLITGNEDKLELSYLARYKNDLLPYRWLKEISIIRDKHDCRQIVILGQAYKPEIDDVRNSPGTLIYKHLPNSKIIDPYVNNDYYALRGADLAVFTTPHSCYSEVSPEFLQRIMKGNVIFDCCGAISRRRFEAQGFKVFGIPEE